MPFTANITGVADVDHSLVTAYASGILIASGQAQILESFVTTNVVVGGKQIAFAKYGAFPLATTPLTEKEDVTSVALADSEVLLAPKEYGMSATTTNLASIQTGGRVDMAAVQHVGLNMGRTQDKLIIDALMTSANVEASALSGSQLDGQYSKLAAKNVAMDADGLYTLVASEAQIAILRNESGFVDVAKYVNAAGVLKNEVGIYKGHRIVRHSAVPAGTAISFGGNAIGKAVSQAPAMVMTSGQDKLNRFVNVGWYGVFAYGLIDTDAVEILAI